MSYQRALWHSGLTYRTYCPYCRIYTTYTDYNLGYRAWYADGFVYCPQCRRPLRHNENNAVNPDGSPYFPFPIRTPPAPGYIAYPIESLALYPAYQQPQYQQPVQQVYQQPVYQQPVQQPQYQQPVYQQSVQQPVQQPIQQPVVQQPEEKSSAPQEDEPAAEMLKCPSCGHEYEQDGSHFCRQCGAKLDEE